MWRAPERVPSTPALGVCALACWGASSRRLRACAGTLRRTHRLAHIPYTHTLRQSEIASSWRAQTRLRGGESREG
eukprot:2333917-Rhodomonas_salina.1